MKNRIVFWILSAIFIIVACIIYETASPLVILLACVFVIIMTGVLGTIYLVKKDKSRLKP